MATKKPQVSAQDEDLDFLDDDAGKGYDSSKSTIPRILIMQPAPPSQYIEGSEDYIPGAKPGCFLNSATKDVYKDLEIIPVFMQRVWLEWVPKDLGGGFRGKHKPNSIHIIGDLYKGARTVNGNEIKEALEIYGLIPKHMDDGPVLLSLTSTAIKYGDLWIEKNKMERTPKGNIPPIFGSVWKLSTKLNKNKQGQWFSIGIDKSVLAERVRWISREEYEEVKKTVEYLESAVTQFLLPEDGSNGQAYLTAPDEEQPNF
jgi:hypothetical protein